MTTQWHFEDADDFPEQTAIDSIITTAAAKARGPFQLTCMCTSGWFANLFSRTLTVDYVAC
jgi:hypothetical protein